MIAGFSETSFPQVPKVSFLCDQGKLCAYGSDYEILFKKKKKLLTDSVWLFCWVFFKKKKKKEVIELVEGSHSGTLGRCPS